ncbi:PAN domain-containing protein [Rhizobium sp. BK176]|uniref:PAN domain-containing protein n=1 Tax=Rhizobium sp. BK176 TaxID=2587071 RepID=UPI0021673EFC|nr:PAN domain-containing protein [Rhizobium sp. BK176]MCS4089343.1 hypothetical protein [Rhizobium sp. BK176]
MSLVDAKPNPYDSDIGSALKRFCREGVFCLHFTGSSKATAFLDEKPDRIATGLSEVAGFLRSYWKEIDPDRLEDIPVPLILTSQQGRVFGRSDGDRASVTVTTEDKRVVQTESLDFNLHANLVQLKLSRPLQMTSPLRRALTRSALTLTTYGYLPETAALEHRSGRRLPVPDSFGDGRSSSRDSKDAIGFADYDGFKGLLGAPVLNEKNEVVGVQIGAVDGSSIFGWLASGGLLKYPETAIAGFETATIKLPPEECQSICLERSGCAAFDHSSRDNVCRLFFSVSSGQPTTGSTAGSREPIIGYRTPAGVE